MEHLPLNQKEGNRDKTLCQSVTVVNNDTLVETTVGKYTCLS